MPSVDRHMSDDNRPGLQAAMRNEQTAVLESDQFEHAPVLSKLLSYLVDQTLSGQADRIKSYAVAIDGLGRPDSYDVKSDSYPRVQMSRLRKALDLHYAAHGPIDGLCLYLKPGAYRVRIGAPEVAYPHHYHAPAKPTGGTGGLADGYVNRRANGRADYIGYAAQSLVPESRGPTSAFANVLTGIRRSGAAIAGLVILVLALWIGWQNMPPRVQPAIQIRAMVESPVVEVAAIESARTAASSERARVVSDMFIDGLMRSWVARIRAGTGGATGTPASYRLELRLDGVDPAGETVYGRLIDLHTSTLIWSGTANLSTNTAAVPDEIAPMIARLNGPYGVIARHETARLGDNNDGGYACLLRYFVFLQTRTGAETGQAAQCLKKPVGEQRLAATVFAVRAFFAIESTLGKERGQARQDAERFARLAMGANANDAYAQFAAARFAYLKSNCVSANTHTDHALAENPNDPLILAILAGLSHVCGYPQAEALLDRAFRVRSKDDVFSRPFLVFASVSQGKLDRIESLRTVARPAAGPLLQNYLLTETMVAAAQGRTAQASVLWREFAARYPGTGPTDEDKLRTIFLSDVLRKRALDFLTAKGVTKG